MQSIQFFYFLLYFFSFIHIACDLICKFDSIHFVQCVIVITKFHFHIYIFCGVDYVDNAGMCVCASFTNGTVPTVSKVDCQSLRFIVSIGLLYEEASTLLEPIDDSYSFHSVHILSPFLSMVVKRDSNAFRCILNFL